MGYTSVNPVSVGDATKKSHYDTVFDNTIFNNDNAFPGAFQKLILTRPTVATIDIDADHVQLVNTSNKAKTVSSINLTANLGNSGANGLDTGSEANSTWYSSWIIAKADGTVASLLSVSLTVSAITFPSGYTFGKLVGMVRNNGSGNLIDFKQIDKLIQYIARQAVVSALAQTSFTAQTLVVQAPTASGVLKSVSFGVIGNGGTGVMALSTDGTNTMASISFSTANGGVGQTAALGTSSTFGKLLMDGDDLQYLVSQNSGDLVVIGFELNI